ncbi:hypothetical protein HIM_09546 [Hirsutella minnesotensis 3608]|uniref:Uncharacterized protein n=1 Tax=Hirsutella minnesotensis 3608 TaxID=1043627 RepID=A0A0F8A322_9HYPO|nr:hypothetical protein HIM_09546 [Hirsutella minnesotensis 3608]
MPAVHDIWRIDRESREQQPEFSASQARKTNVDSTESLRHSFFQPVSRHCHHDARFDPWNSSATGHQRSSHRPGTAWRDARGQKLNDQFSRHATRGGHDHDGPDEQGQQPKRTVADLLTRPGLMKQGLDRQRQRQDVDGASGQTQDGNAPRRAIFDGVVVYVNGSRPPPSLVTGPAAGADSRAASSTGRLAGRPGAP